MALLFPPLAGGLVGGAGGVCSPAVVASLVLSSMGAPQVLLCAGVVVVVIGVLWVTVPRFVVGGVGGGVSRAGLVAWVFLVLVLGGLRVGDRWFRACHSWLVFGRLVVLVVSVVPGVGMFPSAVLGSVVTGVASVAV